MKPCPYCGDCPPDGECGCIASEDVAALRAQVEDLKSAGRTARDDATSALDLLSRVRFALGDNGTRMQGELMDYCRELAALPGRVAELEETIKDMQSDYDELLQRTKDLYH